MRTTFNLLLLAFILILLLPGCSILKKQKTETKFIYTVKDSIRYIEREVTCYRDTTIFQYIQGQTDSIIIPGTPVQGILNIKPRQLQNDFSVATAWVKDDSLCMILRQKDTTLQFRLKNAITERDHYKSLYASIKDKESTATSQQVSKVSILPWWLWVVAGMVSVSWSLSFITGKSLTRSLYEFLIHRK